MKSRDLVRKLSTLVDHHQRGELSTQVNRNQELERSALYDSSVLERSSRFSCFSILVLALDKSISLIILCTPRTEIGKNSNYLKFCHQFEKSKIIELFCQEFAFYWYTLICCGFTQASRLQICVLEQENLQDMT